MGRSEGPWGCPGGAGHSLPGTLEASLSKLAFPNPSPRPFWEALLGPAPRSSREISFTTPVFHVGALRKELGGLAKEKFQIHSEVQAGLSWRCQEGISQPRDGAGNEEEFLAGTTSPVPGTAGASRRQWCLGKAP